VETDDSSSFYPYASSTRRLSSDIFADEQSQDSFFVTKNRTDSIAPAPILEQITENSEGESKIEYLTTSGLEEDFEGSSSVFEREIVEKSDGGNFTHICTNNRNTRKLRPLLYCKLLIIIRLDCSL